MNIELKDLALTLLIGLYTCLALRAIANQISQASFRRLLITSIPELKELASESRKNAGTPGLFASAIALGLCVSAGLVVQDLSFRSGDAGTMPWFLEHSPAGGVHWLRHRYAPSSTGELPRHSSESDLRWSALGGSSGSQLYKELAANVFALTPNVPRPPVSKYIEGCYQALYYRAKNTVYRVPQYFEELDRLQSRIDFARSWTTVSWALAGIACLLMAASALRRKETLGLLKLALILGLLHLASFYAYHRESDEYNKRVYGYFSTMLETHDASVQKWQPDLGCAKP
jgi:hypothetical protein